MLTNRRLLSDFVLKFERLKFGVEVLMFEPVIRVHVYSAHGLDGTIMTRCHRCSAALETVFVTESRCVRRRYSSLWCALNIAGTFQNVRARESTEFEQSMLNMVGGTFYVNFWDQHRVVLTQRWIW